MGQSTAFYGFIPYPHFKMSIVKTDSKIMKKNIVKSTDSTVLSKLK